MRKIDFFHKTNYLFTRDGFKNVYIWLAEDVNMLKLVQLRASSSSPERENIFKPNYTSLENQVKYVLHRSDYCFFRYHVL